MCSLLRVSDALTELSVRLEDAVSRLRAGNLAADAALAMIEDCAHLAAQASTVADDRVRAALEPLPDLPGQLPLPAHG
jgi:hypothetical protein